MAGRYGGADGTVALSRLLNSDGARPARPKPTAEDYAAAARAIVPGATHWDSKAATWPKDKLKPSHESLKVELTGRLGCEKVGKKLIKNMSMPELLKALHETPLARAPHDSEGGKEGDKEGDNAKTRDRWCNVMHGPRLAHAIIT